VSGGENTGVRSYQRIFSPDRRIHQIEGRPLPVPGGVPLRWLGWMLAALVAILALGSGSIFVPATAAVAAGAGGLTIGDRTAGLLAATAAVAGTLVLGVVLGALDWPFRLVIAPMAVATAATQATPDGRRPERFALSWAAHRLAPARRSLGRRLPPVAESHRTDTRIWIAPDARGLRLRHSRITGPGSVGFVSPVIVRRRLVGGGLVASEPRLFSRRSRLRHRLVLDEGQTLEVRP
jgi:MFS family permease